MLQIKPIPGFPEYFASEDGDIYSMKSGKIKKLSPFKSQSGKGYYSIALTNEKGQLKKVLVHRVIAITFIPNPDNLPEVDHKDNDIWNVKSSNLRWVTRKFNLYRSYETMSPVRNFVKSDLYCDEVLVKECESVTEAAKYAHTNFGVPRMMIEKHREWKEFKIVKHINA